MHLKSVGDLQNDFDERFQIQSPSFLLRQRDVSYGSVFSKRVAAMGITEVVTAARSPWQNAYVERFNRTYREEVLDAYLFDDLPEVRQVTENWLETYNTIRPHEALQGLPPRQFARQQA